jgi:diamine N-acetyltransferase
VVTVVAEPDRFVFTVHGRDGLDLIEPLWRGLAVYHRKQAAANAPAFLEEMEARTFVSRRDELLAKNRNRALRVELAFDPAAGAPVGYCVASGVPDGLGEVESVFVKETYRGRGIGSALLEHALTWMDEIGTVEQAISVFAGNDRALPFYARHGFSPRFVILVRRSPG